MAWTEWIFVLFFIGCLSAAPDKYYGYDVLEKRGGNPSTLYLSRHVRMFNCCDPLFNCVLQVLRVVPGSNSWFIGRHVHRLDVAR